MRLATLLPSALLLALVSSALPVAPQSAFDATFQPKPGNSWWVEVGVTASQPLAGVDARANGGPWVALAKQSWGAWARSFHVPDGSAVEFRARSTSGATDMSATYLWPDATPGTWTPPALTFDHRAGNEWWVEARLTGSYSVHGVHVAESDGDVAELRLNDWGNWVGSLRIEPGHLVQFTAHARDGTPAQRSCWFTHPDGRTPSGGETCPGEPVGTSPPPSPPADTAFGPKAGNAWWIETYAFTGKGAGDVRLVEARANGGPWRALSLRDWGAWAGSFHVPDGSVVEFRATTASGTDVSDRFVWPSARLAGGSGAWPEEGSYVHYRMAQGVAGSTDTRLDAFFVRHAGAWWMECKGTSFDKPSYRADFSRDPPWGPLRTTQEPVRPIAPGDRVMAGTLFACNPGLADLVVTETHVHEQRNDGKVVSARFWVGVTPDDGCGGCNSVDADWDQATGLVAWYHDGGTGWSWGQLQDTDAPLKRA